MINDSISFSLDNFSDKSEKKKFVKQQHPFLAQFTTVIS